MADNQSVYEEKESNINEMNVQNETSAPAVPGGVAFQKSGMSHSPRMPGAFPVRLMVRPVIPLCVPA